MTSFSVRYRCDQGSSPNPGGIVELAERSFFDYAPIAQTTGTSAAAGRRAGSGTAVEIAAMVADILLTSPYAREVPGSAVQTRAEIESRVVTRIRAGRRLSGLMLWAPKKHWVHGPDSSIDVAELVALRTLFDIHSAVRRVYDPGIHFHVHVEDLEHAFVHGWSIQLEEDMERYISRLCAAVEVLGLQELISVTRATSLASGERELEAWRLRMAQNLSALRAYWYDSERNGLERFERYGTYRALERLGWRGPIPREMRDFYLGRIKRGNCRGIEMAEAADMVMRNLAGILLHHQEHLLRVSDDPRPLIVSFMPQPPGTELHLTLGRVNLRFVSRKASHSADKAAPWSVKGCLHERRGRLLPTFTSRRQPLGPYAQACAGTFVLARGRHRVPVRADLLLGNKEKMSALERKRRAEQRLCD
ncbi:hypothetical protein FJY68_08750 [candidate division WOR-3 bacterium]|uniref:Uncharacterized protein n=1 Tax=candidate division WOR-3 bacterium TaxID=2052148 RepID=A0A938BRS4_UNCW3|nr:hypothetical protein [candidate division WOR-3 bacterium]